MKTRFITIVTLIVLSGCTVTPATVQTVETLEIAGAQLKGELGNTIRSIRDRLLSVVAEIEAEIDFPDDVGILSPKEEDIRTLRQEVITPLTALLDRYHAAHFFREGIKLAVVGKPNVGKSSLVNRFIQKDRIIVTPIPGTTRDLIEETVDIQGVPVVITDTAGLHQTDDPVESLITREPGLAQQREGIIPR